MMPYPACSGLEDALEIHGEWQLRGIRNVVVTTLSGSRNEEAMVACVEEYKPLTEDLGRYGTLARYAGWGDYTAEAETVAGPMSMAASARPRCLKTR